MPEHLTPRADLPSPTEGDDVPFSVAFSDVNGNPIDITGWTVSLTIAERDATPIIEKDVTTHDNATAGETSFDLAPNETSGLEGLKKYDIQVKKSDGTVKTAVIGTIDFSDGYTDRSV